jgi:hypothetical protein
MESSSSAAGFGAGEVGGVGVYAADHVRGAEDEAVGGMGFGVSKEAVGGGNDFFGGMGLVGRQEAYSSEEGGIYSPGIV